MLTMIHLRLAPEGGCSHQVRTLLGATALCVPRAASTSPRLGLLVRGWYEVPARHEVSITQARLSSYWSFP